MAKMFLGGEFEPVDVGIGDVQVVRVSGLDYGVRACVHLGLPVALPLLLVQEERGVRQRAGSHRRQADQVRSKNV